MAKNLNWNEYPENMSLGGVPGACSDLADAFASHFDNKVRTSKALARVDPNGVYNGRRHFWFKIDSI